MFVLYILIYPFTHILVYGKNLRIPYDQFQFSLFNCAKGRNFFRAINEEELVLEQLDFEKQLLKKKKKKRKSEMKSRRQWLNK